MSKEPRIHPTAEVSDQAKIGNGTMIWNWVQIRENVIIGDESIVSKGVYIDAGVRVGARVKIQNNVSVFHGVQIEDGVFIGPHVCFTNDLFPKAINKDGSLKSGDDWKVAETVLKYGSSVGANSTIIAGVTVGRNALIAAGSVVTKDVPDHGLVRGNPARLISYVCSCGEKLIEQSGNSWHCQACGDDFNLKPIDPL